MRGSRRFARFVVASAAIHIVALVLAAKVDWHLPAPPPAVRVRVVPLERPADARSARDALTPPDPPRPDARLARPAPTPTPRAAPTPPPQRPGGQVVDLPSRLRPGERAERPPDTRYLSDRERVVERETQARVRPGAPGEAGEAGRPDGEGDAATRPPALAAPPEPPVRAARPLPPADVSDRGRPAPAPPPAAPEPPRSVARAEPPPPVAPRAAEPLRTPDARTRAPATPSPTGEGRIARLEPSPPAQLPRPAAPIEPPRDALPAAPGAPTARGSRASPRPDDGGADDAPPARRLPGLDRLIPGPEQLARTTPPEPARRGTGGQRREGGTGPRDYLPGVEEGEETFLSSREFRYAYYFNHVKQAIGAHWSPGVALERAYPGGVSLPGELFTELTIVVEKDGRVTTTDMTRASGVGPVDQEAVRAVRAAGQFPAPPAGVLDPDSRLRFQFGFVVTTGGGRLTFYGPDDEDLRDRFRDPFGRGRAPRAR